MILVTEERVSLSGPEAYSCPEGEVGSLMYSGSHGAEGLLCMVTLECTVSQFIFNITAF